MKRDSKYLLRQYGGLACLLAAAWLAYRTSVLIFGHTRLAVLYAILCVALLLGSVVLLSTKEEV